MLIVKVNFIPSKDDGYKTYSTPPFLPFLYRTVGNEITSANSCSNKAPYGNLHIYIGLIRIVFIISRTKCKTYKRVDWHLTKNRNNHGARHLEIRKLLPAAIFSQLETK